MSYLLLLIALAGSLTVSSCFWFVCAELVTRLWDSEEQLKALRREGSGEASDWFPQQLWSLQALNFLSEALHFLSPSAEPPTEPS